MRDGLKQFHQLCKAIVGHTALFAKVMVIGRDELVEWHTTLLAVTQQVNDLQRKLFGALHLVGCLVCRRTEG